MKDGISERTYLITAVFALVYFLAANAVVFWFGNAALWTGYHVAKTLLKYVIQTSVVIGKLLMQIVDGVAW